MRFSRLSFRQKILLSFFFVFVIFLTFLFPFASHSVRTIVRKTFKQRALDLVKKVSTEPTINDLILKLSEEQQKLFFRVTLLNDKGEVLYDSHSAQISDAFNKKRKFPPEIVEALQGSTGYNEEYSPLMGQKLIYVARAFDFHGQVLILRTAFPFRQFDELITDFEVGFLILGSIVLLLFSVLTWFIIHYLTKPIQKIIEAVKPYQEGSQELIPKIQLDPRYTSDEFSKLAITLNSLSDKIQGQINALTLERNNKELILESLGEGVIAVDSHMIVLYANSVALDFLDVDKNSLISKNLNVTKQFHCIELLQKCQRDKVPIASSLKLSKKNRLFLELLAVPMYKQDGAVLVLQDKSAHYKMIEIGKDFVANASHELKTPITIIRGFAETMHDHPDLPREITVDIVNKIVRNCKRMETLVRNLLTLADIENLPPSRLQECTPLELIENCKQLVLSVYNTAQIDIISKESQPVHIIADPDLLELAIMNLLTNAAKYSNPPAQIMINLEVIGDQLQISIADKGIGIPQEDQDHIFDRFYTVDKAHSRKLGGSGLGLSITKTIIEKHLGKISVHSIISQGTVFTILLPLQQEGMQI